MSASRAVVRARSAGGVVWRRTAEGLEIIVCNRTDPGISTLPKGTPEPGESLLETALREVLEETGIATAAGSPLGSIEYWFAIPGARVRKTVHWWLMTPIGGDLAHHDHEFDSVEWLPVAEALKQLTYTDERDLVGRALQHIPTGAQT